MTNDNQDALREAERLEKEWSGTANQQDKNDKVAAHLRRLVAAHLRRLVAENEALRKSAPLCEKHQPSGGTRNNCLVCVGEQLQASLSRISYVCGDPNEMEVSSYDAHYDEAAVVDQVRALRAENEAKDALLRQAVEALKTGQIRAVSEWEVRDVTPKIVREAIAAIRQHLGIAQ